MQELNQELHKRNKSYGTAAGKHTDEIYNEFIKPKGITDILDYGCGKNFFAAKMQKLAKNVNVTSYDPGIEEFATRPARKFEAVLCHDVLEHVEPELIDNVLRDILEYGNKWFYLSIGLGPSNKKLADGRDNHLIQESSQWWFEKLTKLGFRIEKWRQIDELGKKRVPYVFVCICSKE